MATNLKDAEGGHPLGRVVGDLFGLSLPEMVQMLSLGGRTGKVSITSESGSGQLWFVDGSATHAESGDKTGTVAFHEMLRWKSGRFVIEDKERADVQTLHGDTMLIVLDGLRCIDEEAAAVSDTEAHEQAAAPPVEPARRSVSSRRRKLVVGVAFVGVISLVGASVFSVTAIVSGGDLDLLGRAETIRSTGSGFTTPVEDRAGPTVAFGPMESDRPEYWLAEMNWSPEPEQDEEKIRSQPNEDETIEAATTTIEEVPADPFLDIGQTTLFVEDSALPAVEYPVSIEPGYVDLVVTSNVKAGLLTVAVDDHTVYSQELRKQTKSVKRFLRKLTGQADQQFEVPLEIEPGLHEILARVELHGKSTSFEKRLELDLAPGDREAVQVNVGRTFGKRLSMAVVRQESGEEVAE